MRCGDISFSKLPHFLKKRKLNFVKLATNLHSYSTATRFCYKKARQNLACTAKKKKRKIKVKNYGENHKNIFHKKRGNNFHGNLIYGTHKMCMKTKSVECIAQTEKVL